MKKLLLSLILLSFFFTAPARPEAVNITRGPNIEAVLDSADVHQGIVYPDHLDGEVADAALAENFIGAAAISAADADTPAKPDLSWPVILAIVGGIMTLLKAIVRLTPTNKDNMIVDGIDKFLGLFLPGVVNLIPNIIIKK